MKSPRALTSLLLTASLFCSCHGRRIPAAAILPGLSNFFGNEEKKEPLPPPRGPQPHQQQLAPPKRPPPPPPRKQQKDQQETAKANPQEDEESHESKDLEPLPPPPPPREDRQQQDEQVWDPFQPYAPPGAWGAPPHAADGGIWGTPHAQYGDWQQQQQQQQYYPEQGMHQHLEEFIAREHELMEQIQNLTTSLQTFEQREDLHIRQLDVLTERVMDAEAAAAAERNELVEHRNNCTELGRTIAALNDELEEWKQKCATLQEQHEQDQETVKEIKETLKERDFEVEELASSIETARLTTERENYFAERRQRKKRGFFAWLFGIGRDDSDDDEERLQELAKSTLLRALQRERNNVDELEVALSTLQQNNSAISEMVESRDMLINELNDRVAVFEEDKLVLKAALRQLQKEMKEEAPKTQKLIHDLQQANEEINHLNEEIQSLLSTHQNEVSVLQQAIFEKQTAINETESNLTVIGTYVDKLEERLATFAITRRDIDVREQRCKEIEERVVQAESERDEMKQKAEEFAVEHEDLKKLLDELVQERTTLRHEKEALIAERDKLLAGENALREAVTSLEQDVEELDGVAQEWRSKVVQLELELGEEAMKARTAEERYEHLLSEFEALQESRNEQPKEEVLELDSSEEEEERSSAPEESATIWLPQGKQKTEQSDRENVPLRSLRKFFSQKTGLHGVFTPSSRQLVPPPPRVPPTSSGMPKQMPPRPPNLPPPA